MIWIGLAAVCANTRSAQIIAPDRKISYECRAMPLKRILPQIAQETGLCFEIDGAEKDDVLAISAAQVTIGDLMSEIAKATSCKWQSGSKGAYRLVESVDALKRDDNEGLSARTRQISAGILRKSEPEKHRNAGASADQVSRSVFALLDTTDKEAIAALTANQRVVFSTLPTAVQRPFSSDPGLELASLITAHNDGLLARSTQEDTDAGLDQTPAFLHANLERARRRIGSIAKALVAVTRRSLLGFESLQANVRLIDPPGKLVFDQTFDLNIDADPSVSGLGAESKPGREAHVDLSDDTKQLCRFYQSIVSGDRSNRKLPAELQTKVFHPSLYDPLSFLASDEVFALAKKLERPVVANLDDKLLPLTDWLNQTPNLDGLEQSLAEAGEEWRVSDKSWLVLRPRSLSQTRLRRIDRSALEKFLNAARSKPLVSLDEVAEYSLHAPSPLEGGFGALYVLCFAPGAFSLSPNALTSWEMLRIYGSFDPATRQALQTGDRLAMTELSAYQFEQLKQMAFGALPYLDVEVGSKSSASGVPGYMRAFVGGIFNDRRDEATEALPNDIPLDGYLSVEVAEEPIAVATNKTGAVQSGPLSVMDLDTMALLSLANKMPYFSESAPILGLPANVKVGKRTLYSFSFQLPTPFKIRAALADNLLAEDAKVVGEGAMPAAIRSMLAARVGSIKSSPVAALLAMAFVAVHPGPSISPP